MPSQIFKIISAPEAKPITAQQLKSLLWRNLDRSDTEWEAEEITPKKDQPRYTTEQIKAWLKYRRKISSLNSWCFCINNLISILDDPQDGIEAVTGRKET